MKKLGLIFLICIFFGGVANAQWFSGDKSANTQGVQKSQESSWSWSSIKTRVIKKWNEFVAWTSGKKTTEEPQNNQQQELASNGPNQGVPAGQSPPVGGVVGAGSPNGNQVGQSPQGTAAAVPVIPGASEEVQALQAKKAQLKQAGQGIRSIKARRIAKPGRRSTDRNVVMSKKSKIPLFRFKSYRKKQKALRKKMALERKSKKGRRKKLPPAVVPIPALDIGEEPVLDSSTFALIDLEELPKAKFVKTDRLETPKIMTSKAYKNLLGKKVKLAKNAKKIKIPRLKSKDKVTRATVDALVYTLNPESLFTPLTVVQFDPEDLKMLRALILFENSDRCHIAAGLFADLTKSKRPEVAEKSRYHLGYCLAEMNLPTESQYHLNYLIRNNHPQYLTQAIRKNVEDVPLHYEGKVAKALLQVKNSSTMPQESMDKINYLLSKYFVKRGEWSPALKYAEIVPKTSKLYYKAQYVAAVSEYGLKRITKSIQRQKQMAAELTKSGADKDVLTLVTVNIGRMSFQKGKYKESIEYFRKVPKEHPLWLQGLTELAWTQLQMKDAAGAIGNMHSIHSPYFSAVFKPESYIVRSIGYLNICQYPDAQKSLSYLKYKYGPWRKVLSSYHKRTSYAQNYDTVIRYLSGKSTNNVDGVPFQALREAARQRDFLNSQNGVNALIEEGEGYGFIRGLIRKDKRRLAARRIRSRKKVAELKAKLKTVNTKPGAMKNLNQWKQELALNRDFLSIYSFRLKTLKEGDRGLRKLAPKAKVRLTSQKRVLQKRAGKQLRKHFKKMARNLKRYFENNELLQYEIYAGSGENLRYKVAGGKTGGPSKRAIDRNPAGEKWDFDGEFWEDEIGNYRSSLKNNCQSLK